MGRHALFLKLCALAYAKSMLFIGNHQPEIGKLHALRNQRMRANDHLPFSGRYSLSGASSFRRSHLASNQSASDSKRCQQLYSAF